MDQVEPIIPGFAPDPSVIRIEDTYFLVNSSFHLFPGLPIFASTDLSSWKHIGNALNRPSQMQLANSSTLLHNIDVGLQNKFVSAEGQALAYVSAVPKGDQVPAEDRIVGTGGLYAATLRHHKGRTYIVCTNAQHVPETRDGEEKLCVEFHNFILFTDDIWSDKWSDPIYFDFWGIDPDLFFDEDGRAYVSGCSWHSEPSVIGCFEIDIATGKKLTPERCIWEGFSKITPEGPHIYKRSGWYYLMTAEGTTFEGHMLAMARSRNIWGPYEECPHNPILRPRPGKPQHTYIQNNGHGELFEDIEGHWWLAYLAVRKDRDGRCGLGRETFLTPVSWPSGEVWPEIGQPTHPKSNSSAANNPLLLVDPKVDFVWIRDPEPSAYEICDDGKEVTVLASRTDLSDCYAGPVSFVGKRQRALCGHASVLLRSCPQSVSAGIAYYKDEHRYARVYYSSEASEIVFEAKNDARRPTSSTITRAPVRGVPETASNIRFRVTYSEQSLNFQYKVEQDSSGWVSAGIADTLDFTDRDFTGPCIGVFATRQAALHDTRSKCSFSDVEL
ncbi:glycosyl hydrolase [Dactylonectria macrodidyma]|uniref:Glycosyl hydrolase n=1 Tax=Dactylonectria macrodidyma TaxID=307937 RepID=A0A9P9DHD6_9HYPO|nr:glycosyl hydrolase [Dactylonectria macrodidyma]